MAYYNNLRMTGTCTLMYRILPGIVDQLQAPDRERLGDDLHAEEATVVHVNRRLLNNNIGIKVAILRPFTPFRCNYRLFSFSLFIFVYLNLNFSFFPQ